MLLELVSRSSMPAPSYATRDKSLDVHCSGSMVASPSRNLVDDKGRHAHRRDEKLACAVAVTAVHPGVYGS
jgi:hypothetical protein